MRILNPGVLAELDELASRFRDASPFRHVVIENFFDAPFAEQLLAQFPCETHPERLVNEFGSPNPKCQRSDLQALGGVYAETDRFIQTIEFLQVMEKLTGIPDLCYDPYYYGAGTHENFHGAGLDPHYDFNIHPMTGQHRRLNAIVYLNKDWRPEWNGGLRLQRDAWNLFDGETIDIEPTFNRCVVFETTERSWHSVPVIKQPEAQRHQSRKSLTIYLYTNMRPASEMAPPHGTVYAQPGLPERICTGHRLDQGDMEIIQSNLERRHNYLREMYKREYRFSEVMEILKRRIAELERAVYLPLTGQVLLEEASQPPYSDRWVGAGFAVKLRALGATRRVRVTLARPDGWKPVGISIRVGGTEAKAVAEAGETVVELNLQTPAMGLFDFSLEAAETQRADTQDVRQLSVLLRRIEFLE